MTTKELINQFVTAHADNRWMDASELEALLTEFAEKLKEPASEDLEQAADKYALTAKPDDWWVDNGGSATPLFYMSSIREAVKFGAQWQKEQDQKEFQLAEEHGILTGMNMEREQMMKGALNAYIAINTFPNTWLPELVICNSDDMKALIERLELEHEDKVKVIIVKDDGCNTGNN